MQRKTLGLGTFLIVLAVGFLVPRARAMQVTLVADSHVNAARPTLNSGAISNINIGGGYTGLMQFDLSLLPAGTTPAQITRAVLRVYVNQLATPGAVNLAPVTSAWSEYGVTFATMPAIGGIAQTFMVSQPNAYVAIDVTAVVQGWLAAPLSNQGLALTAGTAVLQLDSKENDLTAHAPVLDVQVVAQGPAGLPGPAGPAGAVGSPGTSGSPGAMGPMGPSGAQGNVGAQGPAGPQGATGLQGPAGPAGSGVAVSYQGSYSSAAGYALNDIVVDSGSSYISLTASNRGNTPGQAPAAWGLLAQAGVGTAGAQGPIGPQGVAGSAGAIGPAGGTGPQGLPGLAYQGAYASSTNYGVGDVVLWQGASYSSLRASNLGNTPDASPVQWGVLTSPGPQGVAGPSGVPGPAGGPGPQGPAGPAGSPGIQGSQGIPGQAGAQGLTGPQGAAGPSGGTGPQGVAGPVGLSWRGAYNSSTNYALADGVSFNGSAYISIVAGNQGQTPDQSPLVWQLFASAGTAGAGGATGTPGATGPAGPQGLAGPVGPAGAPGTAGPAGAQGVAGPTGAPGVNGLPGITYRGTYSAATTYIVNDAVTFAGSSYIALASSNTGNTPASSPAFWALLAQQGAAGATGPAGVNGANGAAGVQGPDGPQGAAGIPGTAGQNGTPGLVYRGIFASGTNYAANDAVSYSGSSWISLLANNVGNAPDLSPTAWALLARAGDPGAAGSTGSAGAPGATGPAGAAGSQGLSGPAGAPGLVFRGAWAGGSGYAANDAVTYGGATWLAQAASTAVVPGSDPSAWAMLAAAGVAGPTGSTGAAATVKVGSVTTGAAGSAATVVNSGSNTAAVLDFTLPQGAAGAPGAGGGGGISGIPYATMYHAVSYSAKFYSINNTNQSATETAPVLSWVPDGCSASKLVVYSQQAATITITLRSGTPGSMLNTTLTCQVATNQSCTSTVPVAIAAGNFVDLEIDNADSNPVGVWSAVTCN